jgi:hypothetical protein
MSSRQMTGAPVSSPSCCAKVVLPLPAQPRMTIRATIVGLPQEIHERQYAQPVLGLCIASLDFAVIWFRTSQRSL